jgi:hypothetical protein
LHYSQRLTHNLTDSHRKVRKFAMALCEDSCSMFLTSGSLRFYSNPEVPRIRKPMWKARKNEAKISNRMKRHRTVRKGECMQTPVRVITNDDVKACEQHIYNHFIQNIADKLKITHLHLMLPKSLRNRETNQLYNYSSWKWHRL